MIFLHRDFCLAFRQHSVTFSRACQSICVQILLRSDMTKDQNRATYFCHNSNEKLRIDSKLWCRNAFFLSYFGSENLYMYICIYTSIHIQVDIYLYICTYVHMYIHMYVYHHIIYTYIYVHTYEHRDTQTLTHTHMCIYVYIDVWERERERKRKRACAFGRTAHRLIAHKHIHTYVHIYMSHVYTYMQI